MRKALVNAYKSFLVGVAIGVPIRKHPQAALYGAGAGYLMAGGDIDPQIVEYLLKLAKLQSKTKQFKNMPDNGYFTTTLFGTITLTVDKKENVYAGLVNSLDISKGRSLPVSWSEGRVHFRLTPDDEITPADMERALAGGSFSLTFHASGVQRTDVLCFNPETDPDTGKSNWAYTEEYGPDLSIGIGYNAGASQKIGSIRSSNEKSEEGLFYGQ